MKVVIDILNYPIDFIKGLALFIFIILIYNLIKSAIKKDFKEIKELFINISDTAKKFPFIYNLIFIFIIIGMILCTPEISFYLGINDLELIPNGYFIYNVKIQSYDDLTTYTRPAAIEKSSHCVKDRENSHKCYPEYYVHYVYTSDDDYITFEKGSLVSIDSPRELYDDTGNYYHVTLLNKKGYVEGVTESHPSLLQILIVIAEMVTIIILWLLPIWLIGSKRKSNDTQQKIKINIEKKTIGLSTDTKEKNNILDKDYETKIINKLQKEYLDRCVNICQNSADNNAIVCFFEIFEYHYEQYNILINKYNIDKVESTKKIINFWKMNYNIWSVLFHYVFTIVKSYSENPTKKNPDIDSKEDYEVINEICELQKLIFEYQNNQIYSDIYEKYKNIKEKNKDSNNKFMLGEADIEFFDNALTMQHKLDRGEIVAKKK